MNQKARRVSPKPCRWVAKGVLLVAARPHGELVFVEAILVLGFVLVLLALSGGTWGTRPCSRLLGGTESSRSRSRFVT